MMSNTMTVETPQSQETFTVDLSPAPPKATSAAPQPGIQVTGKAIKRIRVALAKEGISPQDGGLRLGVIGGGCSGLSYSIKFDTQPRERDRIFEFDGVRVFNRAPLDPFGGQ